MMNEITFKNAGNILNIKKKTLQMICIYIVFLSNRLYAKTRPSVHKKSNDLLKVKFWLVSMVPLNIAACVKLATHFIYIRSYCSSQRVRVREFYFLISDTVRVCGRPIRA